MLIISKVFTILCLLCLCGNREYPWLSKQPQISNLYFQMSTQEYAVPGQAEGSRDASLERTSIDLSSKLSITCDLLLVILFLFCLWE